MDLPWNEEFNSLSGIVDQAIGDFSDADLRAIRLNKPNGRLTRLVERPLRIVVMGGINVGKSTLVNLLVGMGVSEVSAVPTRSLPTLYHYANRTKLRLVYRDGSSEEIRSISDVDKMAAAPQHVDIGLPIEKLRLIEVMDTPALDSADPHLGTGEVRVRKSDLPIWVTDATQAWKESERQTWSSLPERRQHLGILVVSRSDLLPSQRDLAAVLRRLQTEAGNDFGAIVAVALPAAIEARNIALSGLSETLWRASGGEVLEDALAWRILEHVRKRVSRAGAIMG